MKKTLSLFLACCLLLCSASCLAAEAKDAITIGLVQDLSGGTSVLGNNVAKGFQYAINNINANGGMDGRQVNLITYDTEANVQAAVNAFNKLVAEGASIVMGPPVSNIVSALLPLAKDAQIPLLSLAGAANLYVDENGNVTEWAFLTQCDNTTYGYTMASYAIHELGMTKFALLYDETNAYCTTNVDAFVDYATKHGAQIVSEQTFIGGDLDFTSQLSKIQGSGCDAIFAPNYTQNNIIVLQNRAALGMGDIPILGSLEHCYPFNRTINDPALANNVYMADNISYHDESLNIFKDAYIADMGEDPTTKCYLGWDAAFLIKEAVTACGSTDRTAIRDALEHISGMQGTTGVLTINPETHMLTNVSLVMMKLVNGEYEELGRYNYVE